MLCFRQGYLWGHHLALGSFGVPVGLCASVSLCMIIYSTWCWLGISAPWTCTPASQIHQGLDWMISRSHFNPAKSGILPSG